ncbi:peptidylprolyl isomerase [Acidimicrobiia bacterium EGI L10123]|uniref:peptidylprolyl isomerase n=1 Tax=Salinilacustrithrix flava TaxID=2957203 RepID=UPI003D7C35EB|nr:peptidylprolyl isomerase [Acidimicrobiia bacterium EGI L10123]
MGTSKRERQKQARHEKIEELRRQEQRQATRRRGILIGLGIAAFLAFAIGYSVLTSDDGGDDEVATVDDPETDGTEEETATDGETATEDDGTTDTTEATSETTETTVAGVQPGDTECPPADGSAERQIDFDGPFQDCLEDGVDYQARFTTTEGEVLVDLLEEQMPNTVNNFVALARYGYYDDTLLFRTDPSIDIIQGGSPHTQDNTDQGPGYNIPDEGGEFASDPATGQYTGPFTYEEGQLIMARSMGPDSSSAQFFFSTGPNVELLDSQGTYLLFGDVVEGLDVLQEIIGLHEADDSGLGGAPSRDVTIESVEILEL